MYDTQALSTNAAVRTFKADEDLYRQYHVHIPIFVPSIVEIIFPEHATLECVDLNCFFSSLLFHFLTLLFRYFSFLSCDHNVPVNVQSILWKHFDMCNLLQRGNRFSMLSWYLQFFYIFFFVSLIHELLILSFPVGN